MPVPVDISSTVRRALSEDVGTGDITADLLPPGLVVVATVWCREAAVLCGRPWFNEVYRQLEPSIAVDWRFEDGDELPPQSPVCTVRGPARAVLTGERTALNFLQLLSGTATVTRRHVELLRGTKTRLRDTRKTLPGLRTAQKYAVACGGGENHRMGLYDAVLIKENHIRSAGGVAAAVHLAKTRGRQIEVEVENLDELEAAIAAGADCVLLDNFRPEDIGRAVALSAGRATLEASGGIDAHQLAAIAATGVDYISMGSLTKHVRAIDFSMEFGEADDGR